MKLWLVLILAAMLAGCCCPRPDPCCPPPDDDPPRYCIYKVLDPAGDCPEPAPKYLCVPCTKTCLPRKTIKVGKCTYYVSGPVTLECEKCPKGGLVVR